jgi:hypothetical protein
MSALAWWAVPAVSLVLAVAWVAWVSRERPRADTHETVQAHERFKAAFDTRPTRPDPTYVDGRGPVAARDRPPA